MTKKNIVTTNGPGCIKVKMHNQLGVSNSLPNLAPVDDTRIRIKTNVKEKAIMLELVMLVKRPHFVWANSYKGLPLKLFILPSFNSIWLSQFKILGDDGPIRL
jgi:hypothetical protein